MADTPAMQVAQRGAQDIARPGTPVDEASWQKPVIWRLRARASILPRPQH